MQRVRLTSKVSQISTDTEILDNTNSKHLELYSIMAEYDNAGFPLTYCLLSTATAIEPQKRMTALASWARCVRDKYGINPTFTHVDKDMAEIGCVKDVWKTKVSLCWWHLRRAVRTRLGKAKLATTPYDANKAHLEFEFIDMTFTPRGTKTDVEDYEGGLPEESKPVAPPAPPRPEPSPFGNATNTLRIKVPLPSHPQAVTGSSLAASRPRRKGSSTTEKENQSADEDETGDGEDDEEGRHTFCPAVYRESIVDMMEKHYCAHPMIPGYAAPDASAIRQWAVQQIYRFCVQNGLPEVWAYLWENWYRPKRWELWARSTHEMIPVLKTTMILESQ